MPGLEEFISLDEAARRYHIPAKVLMEMVESGKIRAVRVDEGVAVDKETLSTLVAQKQATEGGDELVSISEAARRLGLNSGIVWWWYKHGWLPAQGRGPNRIIFVSFNHAKALAALRNERGKRGRRLIPRTSG